MTSVNEQLLQAVLTPLQVVHHKLTNDSHMHSGPAQNSHYSLLLVSEQFTGLMPVKRHQLVYDLVGDLMGNPIHALALHCYTPQQWASKKNMPVAPDCMGGGKSG
ncbi:MAG: BolA family protein [Gammaproteobacteria bacterium]|jgi:BolA protein|nr:BolA family protein [Gammaproteobacteria bacterium]